MSQFSMIDLINNYASLKESTQDLNLSVNHASKEKDRALLKFEEIFSKEMQLQQVNVLLSKRNSTLAQQVQNLVSEIEFIKRRVAQNFHLRSSFQKNTEPAVNQLASFHEVQELQEKNQKLFSIAQELTSRVEAEEIQLNNKIAELKKVLFTDVEPLILNLKSCIEEKEAKISELNRNGVASSSLEHTKQSSIVLPRLEKIVEDVRQETKRMREEIETRRDFLLKDKKLLEKRVIQAESEAQGKEELVNQHCSELVLLRKEIEDEHRTSSELKRAIRDKTQALQETQVDSTRSTALKNEQSIELERVNNKLSYYTNESVTFKKENESLNNQVNDLNKEIKLLQSQLSASHLETESIQSFMQEELKRLSKERNELEKLLMQTEERSIQESMEYSFSAQKLIDKISQLGIENKASNQKLNELLNELSGYKHLKEKYATSDILTHTLPSNEESFKSYDDIRLELAEARIALSESLSNEQQFVSISQAAKEALSTNEIESQEKHSRLEQLASEQNEKLDHLKSLHDKLIKDREELEKENELKMFQITELFQKEKADFIDELDSLELQRDKFIKLNSTLEAEIACFIEKTENEKNNLKLDMDKALNEATEKYKAELISTQESIRDVQAQKNLIEAELQEDNKQLRLQVKDMESRIDELLALTDKLKDCNGELTQAGVLARFLCQEKVMLEARLRSSATTIKALEEEFKTKSSSLDNLRKTLDEAIYKSKETPHPDTNKTVTANTDQSIQRFKEEKLLLESEINDLISKNEHLSEEVNTLKERINLSNEKNIRLQHEIELKQREATFLENTNQEYYKLVQRAQDGIEHGKIESARFIEELEERIVSSKDVYEQTLASLEEKISQYRKKIQLYNTKSSRYYAIGIKLRKQLEPYRSLSGKLDESQINQLVAIRDLLGVAEFEEEVAVGKLLSQIDELKHEIAVKEHLYVTLEHQYKEKEQKLLQTGCTIDVLNNNLMEAQIKSTNEQEGQTEELSKNQSHNPQEHRPYGQFRDAFELESQNNIFSPPQGQKRFTLDNYQEEDNNDNTKFSTQLSPFQHHPIMTNNNDVSDFSLPTKKPKTPSPE